MKILPKQLMMQNCLLRDTPIILLDEATSALDNVTQAKIMKNLSEVRKCKTVFIIAHRLSTVVNADKILLLRMERYWIRGRTESF